ncbi:MAG: extracellular solute-binding protein [Coriobacteriales bacterium]|nr:extracellular solute-binding protein [Coriobacteriales bacterium]
MKKITSYLNLLGIYKILLSVAVLLSFSLSSCTLAQQTNDDSSSSEFSFSEQEISLPDGLTSIYSMEKIDSGRLMAVCSDQYGSRLEVWELHSDNTWEKIINLLPMLKLTALEMVSCASVAQDGSILCGVMSIGAIGQANDSGTKVFWVDIQTKDVKEYRIELPSPDLPPDLTADGGIGIVVGAADGASTETGIILIYPYVKANCAVLQDMQGNLFLLGLRDGSLKKIDTGTELSSESVFAIYDSKLLCLVEGHGGAPHLVSLGLDTLTVTDIAPVLQENIEKLLAQSALSSGLFSPFLFVDVSDTGKESLLMCTSRGIYRNIDGDVIQMTDGDGTIITNPQVHVFGCILSSDIGFMLAGGLRDFTGSETKLYCYYPAEEQPMSDATLTVYSLYDNVDVRQAVSSFKGANPSIDVRLQIGINDTSITYDDALRELNVALLSGKGPDVLFLDGLPLKDLEAQEALLEITDVAEELLQAGGYYENIVSSLSANGKYYAIPSQFSFPLIIGNSEAIAKINNLSTLADAAKRIAALDEATVEFDGSTIATNIFCASYPSLFQDGIPDKSAIREFYSTLQELAILAPDSFSDLSAKINSQGNDSVKRRQAVEDLLVNPNNLILQNWDSEGDYCLFEVIKDALDYKVSYRPFKLGNTVNFIPKSIIGIPATSANSNLAKNFIRHMFSSEVQSFFNKSSLTVLQSEANKVFEEGAFAILTDDGKTLVLEKMPDDFIPAYQDLVSSLNYPVLDNPAIRDVIFGELDALLKGEQTLDEAVSNAEAKLRLYFAE